VLQCNGIEECCRVLQCGAVCCNTLICPSTSTATKAKHPAVARCGCELSGSTLNVSPTGSAANGASETSRRGEGSGGAGLGSFPPAFLRFQATVVQREITTNCMAPNSWSFHYTAPDLWFFHCFIHKDITEMCPSHCVHYLLSAPTTPTPHLTQTGLTGYPEVEFQTIVTKVGNNAVSSSSIT